MWFLLLLYLVSPRALVRLGWLFAVLIAFVVIAIEIGKFDRLGYL